MTEYLRMSGVYWLVGAMDVIGEAGQADTEFILDFVKRNQNEDGGYAASDGHDSHVLHTLSAIQVSDGYTARQRDILTPELLIQGPQDPQPHGFGG